MSNISKIYIHVFQLGRLYTALQSMFSRLNKSFSETTQLSKEISDIYLTSPFDIFFIKSEVFLLDENNLLTQLFIYFVQAHLFIDNTHTQRV